jgi:hypothetical protein
MYGSLYLKSWRKKRRNTHKTLHKWQTQRHQLQRNSCTSYTQQQETCRYYPTAVNTGQWLLEERQSGPDTKVTHLRTRFRNTLPEGNSSKLKKNNNWTFRPLFVQYEARETGLPLLLYRSVSHTVLRTRVDSSSKLKVGAVNNFDQCNIRPFCKVMIDECK